MTILITRGYTNLKTVLLLYSIKWYFYIHREINNLYRQNYFLAEYARDNFFKKWSNIEIRKKILIQKNMKKEKKINLKKVLIEKFRKGFNSKKLYLQISCISRQTIFF